MKTLIQLALVALLPVSFNADAQHTVVSSTDGEKLSIHTYSASSAKAPTILALHGCSGMLNTKGEPNLRTQAYAKLLNTQGWHVVYLDSLTPRGVKSVCGGKSDVTQAQRLQDTRAAIAYLAQQPWVDAQRIALLGWSHGGTATLLASASGVNYAVQPKAAVAFYPGCGNASAFERAGWRPAFPLLMLLGEQDDWTNPIPCQLLAAKHGITQTTYPNAVHGFDSDAKVVQVPSVISQTTGKPVHVGGEPSAKVASQKALVDFLKRSFD